MKTFLLETTPPALTPERLGEALAEAEWVLRPSIQHVAGRETAASGRFLVEQAGRQLPLGELAACDTKGRLWAFSPAADVSGEPLVRQLVSRCSAVDRVWLVPAFLAQVWQRVVGPAGRRRGVGSGRAYGTADRTDLLYTWQRLPKVGSGTSPTGPLMGSWLSSVWDEKPSGGTHLIWSDSSEWIQAVGGPLRSDWPLPLALAGFRCEWTEPAGQSFRVGKGGNGLRAATEEAGEWMGVDRAGVIASATGNPAFVDNLIRAYLALLRKVEERLWPGASRHEATGTGTGSAATIAPAAAAAVPSASATSGLGEAGSRTGSTAGRPAVQEEEVETVGEVRWRGTPVTAVFQPALTDEEYEALLAELESGGGSLRLWGKARSLAVKRVEVEALDLHGRRSVVIDFSPRQLIALFPEGACANSVVRLMVHLLHEVRPSAQIFLGDQPYAAVVRQAWLEATEKGSTQVN
ncbi:MAG: hypothetical protein IMX01_00195 [Limnochordaceae bacterium]|nr:hypothetical protein [Limnochordaceae bacterium]